MKVRTFLLKATCVSALILSGGLQPSLFAQTSQQETDIFTNSAMPQQTSEDIPTDQLIVKYRDDRPSIQAAESAQMARLSAQAGVALTYFRPMSGDAHVLKLPQRMPVDRVERIAAQIAALPEVEYAEPDYIMRPLQTRVYPNDPMFWQQWHYLGPIGIRLPLAWGITTGSSSTVVAVLDTGHARHTDLLNRFLVGYDFIADSWTANDDPTPVANSRDPIPLDPGDWCNDSESSSWHGTHVAGTIAANTNNGIGVAGVNWHAKILSIRVLGRCGGYGSDIADGMRWAAGLPVNGVPPNQYPAKVLNMSLGGSGPCPNLYQSAINAVNSVGAIIVVAAGNENMNVFNARPANCNGVITVGATNAGGRRAPYSNYGSLVDVSAPGGGWYNSVLSTINTGVQRPLDRPQGDGYAQYPGTSMAAPHVAGVVSLMVGLRPCLNSAQAEHILKTTARPIVCDRGPGMCGAGLVDAYQALLATLSLPPC